MYDIIANLVGSSIGIVLACSADYSWTSWQERRRRFGGKREAEYQRALMDDETELSDDEQYTERNRHFEVMEMA